ncbi:SPC2 [Candida theae]|uniref:Signal peptidase complex subunit 2 n=1 Tax=Candida theae TaxID=1198502 RepID=A0AAD5BHI0_9ASCO|nr:SPC2 [Candida theae]KAI5962722.1 SPC2 [Candida theae]
MSQLKKTNLNSVRDLQKTTDENLNSVLQQLGYDESFIITDVKLGLGVATVAIAGLLFLADKKYQFKDIYSITVAACVVYGVLNAILFLINLKYKNVKYIGDDSKGSRITIASDIKKYEPYYNVTITVKDTVVTAAIPFNKFFDVIGYFNRDEFIKLISEEINKVDKKHQ